VRNAILHGMEEQRETLHKNPRGQIVLGFEERGDTLCISCRDDGRGIDRHEISKAVVTRGLAKEESLPGTSTSELFRLLCQEGFSTSHTIDLYSGRGVGVGAVYEAVHACPGEIEIITEVGQGTEFVITIPRVPAVEVNPIAS